MKIKGIKHIFFDLDHTLWDFDKNSALAFEKILKKHRVEINVAQFLDHYEPINLNYWKLYREEKINKADLRYRRLKDTFDTIGLHVTDELIDELAIDYITYLTTFNYLFEGTFEILERLQGKYQLHIITNGFEEAQQRKMDNANIARFFKTVTNSELAGVKKPNPIIFNHALNIAKASPKESVMIGDNLEADVLGAINVGMDAILFNYHNHTAQANIKQIHHLSELNNYF